MKKIKCYLVFLCLVAYFCVGCNKEQNKTNNDDFELDYSKLANNKVDSSGNVYDDNKDCNVIKTKFSISLTDEDVYQQLIKNSQVIGILITVENGKVVCKNANNVNKLEKELNKYLAGEIEAPKETGKAYYYLSWKVTKDLNVTNVVVQTISAEKAVDNTLYWDKDNVVQEENAKPQPTEKPTKTPVATPQPTISVNKFGSIEDILKVCSTRATCETNFDVCTVDVFSKDNPYDVIWDYGDEYNAYIEACDWSLVWDYNYYIKTFPVLAELYHYDKDLLLRHFQTVGVHEGRQGCADFNFDAFMMNSDCPNYKDAYAAYYFDYMLNYDSYKNVNTVRKNNGKPVYTQYDTVLTAMQNQELVYVNKYRKEVNVNDVIAHGEMMNLANLRAYINVHDGYEAHDWAKMNNGKNFQRLAIMIDENFINIAENAVYGYISTMKPYDIYAHNYRNSPEHYTTMVNDIYDIFGTSNVYYGEEFADAYQFDVFMDNK